jgi:hypothetical protein
VATTLTESDVVMISSLSYWGRGGADDQLATIRLTRPAQGTRAAADVPVSCARAIVTNEISADTREQWRAARSRARGRRG